ncbi:hypothetical protein ECDEC6D_0512 [Escherichia coli DEC6D]|nr:hypothetical protein ECDEC6D_0512 [Escherichia coli DEC6D]
MFHFIFSMYKYIKNKNKATISLGRDNFMTAVEKINFLLTRMLQ